MENRLLEMSCLVNQKLERALARATLSGPTLSTRKLFVWTTAVTGTYLPGGTLSTLVQGGTDGFPWAAALGVVVLYGAIAVAVSLIVFRARDIVS
jgi:hypothetical protein